MQTLADFQPSFIASTLNKLKQLKHITAQADHEIRIVVDGGVTANNIAEIAAAGADSFVAGSAIFNSRDYSKTTSLMRAALS